MVWQPHWKRTFCLVIVLAMAVSLFPTESFGILPTDPKVQGILEKAIKYLEDNAERDGNGNKLGGQCLAAMAILKHRKNPNHPRVLAAIQACQAVAQNPDAQLPTDFNYSLGIAIMFMCEVEH